MKKLSFGSMIVSVFQKQRQLQLKAGLALFALIFSSTALASGTSYNETTKLPFSPNVTVLQACTGAGEYLAPDGSCKNILNQGLWLRGMDENTGGLNNVNFMGGKVGIGLFATQTYQEQPQARLDIGGAIKLRNMDLLLESGRTIGVPEDKINKLWAQNGILMWGQEPITTEGGSSNTTTLIEGNTSVITTDSGENGTIIMRTDNAIAMTINNTGKVGIGIAPTKKLHVNGGARFETSSSDAVEIGQGRIYWDTGNSELVILVN